MHIFSDGSFRPIVRKLFIGVVDCSTCSRFPLATSGCFVKIQIARAFLRYFQNCDLQYSHLQPMHFLCLSFVEDW